MPERQGLRHTVILQNVLVLASGQATVRDDGGKPMLSDVVTVALMPEDALKLQTAAGKGGLTLAAAALRRIETCQNRAHDLGENH